MRLENGRGCFGQVLFSPVFDYGFQKRCKGVHCVGLGESFPTSIYLQNLASIPPRTSPFKFARSPRTDPPGVKISFPCNGRTKECRPIRSLLLSMSRRREHRVPTEWTRKESELHIIELPTSMISTPSRMASHQDRQLTEI